MDNKREEEKKKFPIEFEYLEEIISDPLKRIHSIEKTLKNYDEKPLEKSQYEYHPLGWERAKRMSNRPLSKEQLEELRDTIDKQISDRLEAEIKDVEPEYAKEIRDVYHERRYPNPYEGLNEQQMEKARRMEKDLDHSQSFMIQDRKNQNKDVQDRKHIPTFDSLATKLTAGERFLKMLSSSKELVEKSTDKMKNKSKDGKDLQIE